MKMMIAMTGAALLAAVATGAGAIDFQAEIDRVAAAGGGVVTVPAGRHVTKGLMLKSNVELHLEKGAVLEGSPTTNDYPCVHLPCSEGAWMAVVMAIGQTNVAVTGPGEIYGNGRAFPQPLNYGNLQEGWRPRGLFFCNCTNLRLNGFRLRDTGCWGCVVQCCVDVDIRGLTIDNHANANNDGIDIEARNAVIADCDIDAGDDAVCLKSNNPDFEGGNILVTNVIACSNCAAIKMGTASHGTMKDVLFVDCRIEAPRRDFPDMRPGNCKPPKAGWFWSAWRSFLVFPGSTPDVQSCASAISVECVDGGRVENFTFRNITIEGALSAIFVRGGTRKSRACGTPPGKQHIIRNIVFENVRGKVLSWAGNSITGVKGCRVENVTLRNVHLTAPGGGEMSRFYRDVQLPELEGQGPGPSMFNSVLPAWALWARHVDGLTLDGFSVELADGSSDFREEFVFDDVTSLKRK